MVGLLFSRDLRLIWLQNLALLTGYTLVGALLPLLLREHGFSDSTNGFVMGTGSLGLLLSLLVMGRAIDRGDPRHYIALGAAIWTLTAASLGWASSLWIIVTCRFLQGFAYALFYTASLVYLTRSVPNELRGTVVGILEAVGALAIAATPFLAFPLAYNWGYPAAFLTAAGICLVTTLTTIPLHKRPGSNPPATGMPKGMLFFSPHAIWPGLIAACLFSVAVAYVNLSPLIALKIGVSSTGLYMGLRAICTVPTRIFSGAISDRQGPARMVIPGFLTALLAIFLLPFILNPTWAYLVPALFGLGMGSASPALTAWMLKQVPQNERGVAVNTFTIFTEGSGFFGSWLVGSFLQSGSLIGFLILAALLGIGVVTFLGRMAIEKAEAAIITHEG